MKFSTRGRYALRSVVSLAEKYGQGPVPLKRISEEQHISPKYLENIMHLLVNADIVLTAKGKNGGFYLSKDPKNITVFDVLKVAEGSLLPVDCVESAGKCGNTGTCSTRGMWIGLRDIMAGYLKGISLSSLAQSGMLKK